MPTEIEGRTMVAPSLFDDVTTDNAVAEEIHEVEPTSPIEAAKLRIDKTLAYLESSGRPAKTPQIKTMLRELSADLGRYA